MEIILNLLVALEMLGINLCVLGVCSHRKFSRAATAGALLAFTLPIVGCSYFLLSKSQNFGNGNGLFALIGLLYLLPIRLLYWDSLQHIVTVACSSWIYTMMVFVISVHLANAFSLGSFAPRVLFIQSLLYLLTAFLFIRWVRKKFLYVLQNISKKTNLFLTHISFSWFFTIILINLAFVYPQSISLKIVSLLGLTLNSALSYMLIYQLVKSSRSIAHLEEIAYIDPLTGLQNRLSLFRDANALLEKRQPFFLVFMDLDRFKSINDKYGHLIGDAYLCFFADHASLALDSAGTLYRMSGDEFVCLYLGSNPEPFIRSLQKLPGRLPEHDIPFWGCSTGWAAYPGDSASLDRLISLADQKMYENKRVMAAKNRI